jgi:drug/metabolite transporter (DMT)-like permease
MRSQPITPPAPPPAVENTAHSPLFGVGLKVVSALAFTLMSAGVRWLSSRYPVGELIFVRSFFAMIPVIAWLMWRGLTLASARPVALLGHVRRGMIGSTGMACGFISLSLLPLADAVAIGYATPLLVVILAVVVLKEKVRAYRWSAVFIGLIGVLVMLSPHLSGTVPVSGVAAGSAIGAMIALAGAACSAGATIEVRQLTRTETTASIVTVFMMMTSLLSLCTLFFGWVTPNLLDAAVMIALGILGGIGQITLTESYRYADASLVAPFEYTTMIWAVALGFFILGEWPQNVVFIGAGIVIVSGLFVLWRERELGLLRPESQRASAPQRTV